MLLIDPLNLQALESNFMGLDLQYLIVLSVCATICCLEEVNIKLVASHCFG